MNTNSIILSEDIYQLIIDHLAVSKKLSDFNKRKLEGELKYAKLLPATQIPPDTVMINTSVEILDLETGHTFIFDLVSPSEAKMKISKLSVLSPIGLALVGYKEGQEVSWEMPGGLKRYRIQKVSAIML